MKNVPVTKEALASLIKSVLDQARIADPTYTATTNDYINAINKIGDVVTFEYDVPTELTWIDGEKMPEGSTIEEIIEDFPMPLANVPENGIIGNDVPYYPTYRKAAYSYSLGAERWRETRKHDSIQRAMRNESEANKFFADIAYKLESGYKLFRNDCKKALLGKFAMQALNNLKNATAYTATAVITNDDVGKYYKSGNEVAIAFKTKDATSKTWADAIKDGTLVKPEFVTTMAIPTDTTSGENTLIDFKLQVKKATKAKNHSCLSGGLIPSVRNDLMKLVINLSVVPTLDVKTFAGAFNQDKLTSGVEIEEVDSFGKEADEAGVWAMLVDSRGVKLRNQFMETIAVVTSDHMTQYDKEARDIPFYGASTYLHIWKKPE